MRIVCPACETAYDVPDRVVSPGRSLRCARCRTQWVPSPDLPEEEAEEAEALGESLPRAPAPEMPPGPAAMAPLVPRAPAAAPPAGSRGVVIAGWLVSFLLLGARGYAAILWRQPIERAWPAAVRAYAYLGLV